MMKCQSKHLLENRKAIKNKLNVESLKDKQNWQNFRLIKKTRGCK